MSSEHKQDWCHTPETGRVFLTWEKHRRSETLAAALGARYIPLVSELPRMLRYGVLAVRTARVIARERPAIVFVQNPSIVLAVWACMLRRLYGYRLVVDRHSNFKLHTLTATSLKWRLFHGLSRLTNRKADLTIVTNEYLKRIVEDNGGTGFVLQDKLPALGTAETAPARALERPAVAVVCTFSPDEPLDEILRAARLIRGSAHLYVTGRPRLSTSQRGLLADVSDRVTFTGFLPESEYVSLLRNVDLVMVLTTQEHTLVCGAYEAIACGKPVVLSDTEAIRSYFRRGATYCKPTAVSISHGIDEALAGIERLTEGSVAQLNWMKRDWARRFAALCERLGFRADEVERDER